jgi:hypothetical protein
MILMRYQSGHLNQPYKLSETQIHSLKERLRDLAKVFNESPFAKRKELYFIPRKEVILSRLGEEALFHMGVTLLILLLIELKCNAEKSKLSRCRCRNCVRNWKAGIRELATCGAGTPDTFYPNRVLYAQGFELCT